MLGLMLTDQEGKEMEYLLKRELEELLLDLSDDRIEEDIKEAMEVRYQILFKMLARFGSRQDCAKYIRTKKRKRLTVKKQM
jgi:predicted house-cleaning noncanonical NTP pyrophosphatase (MazG superfamily)